LNLKQQNSDNIGSVSACWASLHSVKLKKLAFFITPLIADPKEMRSNCWDRPSQQFSETAGGILKSNSGFKTVFLLAEHDLEDVDFSTCC